MNGYGTKFHFPWLTVAVLAAAAVLERVLRLLCASFSTNVTYKNTVWPTVFAYAAEFCGVVLLAMFLAAVSSAAYAGSQRRAALMMGLGTATLLLEALSALAADLIQHTIRGYEAYAFVNQMMGVLIQLLLPAAGWLIAGLAGRARERADKGGRMAPAHRRTLTGAILLAAAAFCLLQLAFVAYDILSFFREYHYPTAEELRTMITDIVTAVLFGGVLPGGLALLLLPMCRRDAEARR